MRVCWGWAVLLAVIACLPAVAGDDQAKDNSDLKPVAVAAFKNGLGFVIRQGKVALVKGEGRLAVPEATLGTLWLAPLDRNVTLDEVVALREDSKANRSADDIEGLLRANVGKTVTITFNNKDYTGEVVEFPAPKPGVSRPPSPYAGYPYPPEVTPPARVLLFRTQGKILAINPAAITAVLFDSTPNTQYTVPEKSKSLRFRVKDAADAASVNLAYLEKGLGWTPSYLVSLADEETARLTMQAVVVNDAEDLAGAEMFFVVGYPSFAYSDVASPMALQQSLMEFMRSLQSMGSNIPYGALINAPVMAQSAVAYREEPELGTYRTTAADMVGAPEEDLFLYSRKNVTLAKGQRASYDVFWAEVPIEHVYEWEVEPSTGRAEPQYGNRPPGGVDVQHAVWHALRLTNASQFPWTTAPALVVSGDRPIAQSTLDYTPKGANSDLKLTIASDVRSSAEELETERQPRAAKWNGYDYDVVTVKGTLKIKNYKSKAIKLIVTKSLVGDVLTSSDNAKVDKVAQAIRAENPTSRLKWEIPLGAGEEKTLTYTYKFLTR